MLIIYFIIICLCYVIGGERTPKLSEADKQEFCKSLKCDEYGGEPVCGINKKNGLISYKLFKNECLLLQYGCHTIQDDAYGIINMENCNEYTLQGTHNASCPGCVMAEGNPVCGIRPDGEGFRIRIFDNDCLLAKYNCEQKMQFVVTEFFICDPRKGNRTEDSKDSSEYDANVEYVYIRPKENVTKFNSAAAKAKLPTHMPMHKKLIVVHGSLFGMKNINDTVNNFFAATHVMDLPLKSVDSEIDAPTRRRLIQKAGPIHVFVPWTKKPHNISEEPEYLPTIGTCFHRCPMECPDTYAPVCAKAGIDVRQPSIMFLNHCLMDVAQCRLWWLAHENQYSDSEGYDALTNPTYTEASFMFCLGDTINGLYRFLPLIRTLQHMGRFKKKGKFKPFRIRSFAFHNQFLSRDFVPMG